MHVGITTINITNTVCEVDVVVVAVGVLLTVGNATTTKGAAVVQ